MSHPDGRSAAASRRRLPGRHTYAVRRLVVLCAVFATLAVALTLVNAMFGPDDDSSGTSAGSSTSSSVPTASSPGPAPTDTATASTVKQVTVPTKDDPARVLVLGDSDAGNYGPALRDLLNPTGLVTTKIDYHIATGLARPDYFDWPGYMRQVVPQFDPDIVVVTFGGNDAQALRNADGSWAVAHNPGQGLDDTTWRVEYGRRVGETMDYLAADGRTLVWVGITNDNEPQNTARLQVQDAVVRDEVALHPGVRFVDSWSLFSTPGGGWTATITDPRDGVVKQVRRTDGFHLNATGAQILAWEIEQDVLADLRARGAAV